MSDRLSVGIIGLGHVGRRMNALLATRCRVITYDKISGSEYPRGDLLQCDLAIICVDTPALPSGEVDIDNVVEATQRCPCDSILIRATVPPGTTDLLASLTGKRVCFSPEYVGESNFVSNAWEGLERNAPFMIVGGTKGDRQYFLDRLSCIYGPDVVFFQCEAAEAELIKYMENAYFATKVTFVNEFRDLCIGLGLDWYSVREGWLLDPRVERDHSAAFFDSPGYGGKCLPKDVTGLLQYATEHGQRMSLIEMVDSINRRRGVL